MNSISIPNLFIQMKPSDNNKINSIVNITTTYHICCKVEELFFLVKIHILLKIALSFNLD